MRIRKTIKIKKNVAMKDNLSPKTYFNTILFEKVETTRSKKRKTVSEENFEILEFHEYEKMLLINHNVKQLKRMLKHYKQPISGNKPHLIFKLYNFLKFSYFSTIIQKYVRSWQRRNYFKINGLYNRKKCVNDTDFLTLKDINKIPYHQFYSYKDKDNFIYGFNIKSLYNLMMQTEGNLKNPYTRKEFPKNIIKNIRKFIQLSHILKEPIEIVLKNNTDTMSHKKKIALKTLSIFHQIDTFGHITDTSWFLSLSRENLIRFLRELRDIWEYRANLQNDIKRKICPPNGNPFYGINLQSLMQKNSETLQRNILYIMEILISRGIDKDSKALGAFYILAALTLVSQSAATALPWLYQSVA